VLGERKSTFHALQELLHGLLALLGALGDGLDILGDRVAPLLLGLALLAVLNRVVVHGYLKLLDVGCKRAIFLL
jgi:hypothetical protein